MARISVVHKSQGLAVGESTQEAGRSLHNIISFRVLVCNGSCSVWTNPQINTFSSLPMTSNLQWCDSLCTFCAIQCLRWRGRQWNFTSFLFDSSTDMLHLYSHSLLAGAIPYKEEKNTSLSKYSFRASSSSPLSLPNHPQGRRTIRKYDAEVWGNNQLP